MKSEKCDETCCSEPTANEENKQPCPNCEKISQMPVAKYTVTRIVKRELRQEVGEYNYHMCMDEECQIVYYNSHHNFSLDQLKVPIWFKNGADPKYACYCNRVTFYQVAEFVKSDSFTELDTVPDCDIIKEITGRLICKCKERNPTGNCCCNLSLREAFEEANGIKVK